MAGAVESSALSLHRKVFLVTAGLISVVFATALALVDWQVRTATAEDAARHLAATDEAVRQLNEERIEGRNGEMRQLAGRPELVAAFASGDPAAVQAALERLTATLKRANLAVAAGPTGVPLGAHGLGGTPLPPSLAGVEPFASAMKGTGRGLWLLGNQFYELVAAPVRSPADGRLLGVLALGLQIDDKSLVRSAQLTQTEMLLLADGRLVGSSLDNGLARALAPGAAALLPLAPDKLTGAGASYLAHARLFPLHFGGERCVQVMLRSLAGADRLSTQILRGQLAVGCAASLLSFLFAWMGARRITGPLRNLARAMAEMARTGQLRPDFRAVGGEAEVKLIEQTFRQLVFSLEESRRARERSYVEAVGAVVTAADARDHETTGHSFRVAHYAVALAKAMGIRGEALKAVEWGSLLHDVGKMVVPDEILRKVGPLTEAEWHIMRQHPNWGFDMLAEVGFLQQPALEIVYSHHERWDGGGYPRGLAGEEIPLTARIFAVVDTYDAITSDRPYRKAHSHQSAMAEVLRVAGSQLDPAVVEAFCRIPEVELRRLRELCKRIHPGLSLPPDLLDAMTEPETGEMATVAERLAL